MQIIKSTKLSSIIVLLIAYGISMQVSADALASGLSYSPDHWPSRWSSAIRQNQNGKFPSRQKQQMPAEQRTKGKRVSVSEQDLFYSPDAGNHYGRDYRMDRFDYRMARQRNIRDARRLSREAAYAYNDMANMTGPYGGYGSYFGGASHGIGIDPVLGHPGMGIPMMPGTPFGYPMGAYPYGGFPMGMGAWNPPFGAW